MCFLSESCRRLGLLEGDNHWEETMEEAVLTAPPGKIRTLFAIIITSCHPSSPKELWEKFKDSMCDDILRLKRLANPDSNIALDDSIFNQCLFKIDNLCKSMCNRSSTEFGLDEPIYEQDNNMSNALNLSELEQYVNTNRPKLNDQQRDAYEFIMNRLSSDDGGIIFLDAPGGTGKTFLLNLILSSIRLNQQVAIAVASSAIASTFSIGGRTAHAALKIPLDIASKENPTCNISRNSTDGRLLQESKIIVWDKCSMAHRKSLDALNVTLKDLRNTNYFMGGVLLLLAGDFRQILLVIKNSTPAEELDACLKSSSLWYHVSKISLTLNVRTFLFGDVNAKKFSDTLLVIGNGVKNKPHSNEITLNSDICQLVSSCQDLVKKVFPNLTENFMSNKWISERAILTPRIECANKINNIIQEKVNGTSRTYLSIDTVMDGNKSVY